MHSCYLNHSSFVYAFTEFLSFCGCFLAQKAVFMGIWRNWRLRGFCSAIAQNVISNQAICVAISNISPPVNQTSTGCGLAFKCNRILLNSAEEMPKLFIFQDTAQTAIISTKYFFFYSQWLNTVPGTYEGFFIFLFLFCNTYLREWMKRTENKAISSLTSNKICKWVISW